MRLRDIQVESEGIAREFGLSFPRIDYEVVGYEQMSKYAALGGFPTRYPHWSFGMEYYKLNRSYGYGLHRIYEMVLNTDPVVAYLLASNREVDQRLVMLHVCGHAHFFSNNMYFSHTNRNMLQKMGDHATRINEYIDGYGQDKVESFIDAVLSIDDLIDPHSVAIVRDREEEEEEETGRIDADGYMDEYLNPPKYLAAKRAAAKARKEDDHFPKEPTRDVMLFLIKHGQLKDWQSDILGMLRDEAYYFAPQAMTKIMNEGFATWVHSKLMTANLDPVDLVDYAKHYAGGVAIHQASLNPYRLGLFLLRDIEDRWNRGAFGDEWEDEKDMTVRKNWDKHLGLGEEKVLEVIELYNDVGFIDTFMTEDFVRENNLFGYDLDRDTNTYRITTKEFKEVKQQILFQLTNRGRPLVEVVDGNYENRGELYLRHIYEGVPLKSNYVIETLTALRSIWGRPVHLETVFHGENGKGPVRYSSPGGITDLSDK